MDFGDTLFCAVINMGCLPVNAAAVAVFLRAAPSWVPVGALPRLLPMPQTYVEDALKSLGALLEYSRQPTATAGRHVLCVRKGHPFAIAHVLHTASEAAALSDVPFVNADAIRGLHVAAKALLDNTGEAAAFAAHLTTCQLYDPHAVTDACHTALRADDADKDEWDDVITPQLDQ